MIDHRQEKFFKVVLGRIRVDFDEWVEFCMFRKKEKKESPDAGGA